MPNYLLNHSSVILCVHGGMVTHVSVGAAGELINGSPPMLLNDLYFVAGCPNMTPGPCMRVIWVTGSPTRRVNGIPILTNVSVGMSQTADGIVSGPATILVHQTAVTE